MDLYPLWFLIGAAVLGLGWHLLRLRRYRIEGLQRALDEVASAAGWRRPRRAWFLLGVRGEWKGRSTSIEVVRQDHSEDPDWVDLVVRVQVATRGKAVVISRGCDGERPPWWANLSVRRRVRLPDPKLDDAFEVRSNDSGLALWIFQDSGLVSVLRQVVAAPDTNSRVTLRPGGVEVRTAIPVRLSLEVSSALLARLARETWGVAELLVQRIARSPR